MVPGYVARDVSYPDPTSTQEMPFYGEPGICAELARHSARLAKAKLQRVIDGLSMDESNPGVQTALSEAIADVEATLIALRECEAKGPWSR
jgi:hypothetical protein